ncbi:endonuclease G [Agromyces sp. 3263]|uniref:DNA/RNA non-specific endonuclease n=1 Tax=Agromyces sp. 3263 TaxID=2817750 RepID=UPI0028568E19|nr:DNA/RNA non-specific endonuclease [Agromyces sp. 3263]MDR6905754.1 endonuclease G [Agromyces sp. 3263]
MGFDAQFLGVAAPLPRVPEADAAASVELDSVHFTVVLDTVRRFARVTGVNVDGAALVELERGDRWQFDDRIPIDWQAGPLVYADNDLDRGHLVRRRDPVWGPPEVAARANSDTFRYTNAAPQASGFNQSKELWLGLEDHVLEHARAHRQRLSVFTAPVLGDGDPPYRGIRVPLRFWKIAAWNTDGDGSEHGDTGALAAVGFVVDQTPLVDTGSVREPSAGEAPPLGPFRTFQVPIADIAAATGLVMPDLIAADRMPKAVTELGWRRIEEPADILLSSRVRH